MTKYIEILERTDRDSYFELNYKLTIDLPANWQPFYNNELTLSKSGVLSCLPGDTVNSVKAKLLSLWNDFNSGLTDNHQWKFYGTYYDGTQWVLGGVN